MSRSNLEYREFKELVDTKYFDIVPKKQLPSILLIVLAKPPIGDGHFGGNGCGQLDEDGLL